MYEIKGMPFKYKGAINVEDCRTAQDVIIKAGLDWEVGKCPIFAEMNMNPDDVDSFVHNNKMYGECDDVYATYRKDYNIPLGIVKGRYTIVQNIKAFNFFNNAIGKDKAVWQTAGFFGKGERIFISAKLPKNIFVDGDPVENYLIFTTSHDGSTGVKILFSPIRVVCENTLNAAIQNSTNYVSFRHTNSVHDNIDIADEILGICDNKITMIGEYYSNMRKQAISDENAVDTFAKVILNEKEKESINLTGHTVMQLALRDYNAINDTEISMRKINAISEMYNYYHLGIGQKEILGTKWGVYNAITGYYSNIDNSTGIKRMDSILYGDKARKIETAGNILLAA